MSKRLKKVLFILLGIVLTAGIAVGGYFLISNASSATVYNLRILTADGVQINDTSRYLQVNSNNNFAISVDVSTSSGAKSCYFSSSNPSVAKVVVSNGKYYVQYYKAGTATITAYSSVTTSVYDSFTLNVYDNYVNEIVIDNQEDNKLTLYGDGTTYTYDYQSTGVLADVDCNNMLTRVVENYNTDVIENISIDNVNKQLTISSQLVIEDSNQIFYLQTYYVDSYGVEHVVKNYSYNVDVIGYRINDMQILVSEDYLFSNKTYVYLSDTTSADSAYILDGETIISDIVLSNKINNLYFKIRVIYSNNTWKDVSYEDNILPTEIEGSDLNFVGGWARKMDYWYVEMKQETISTLSSSTLDIVRAFSVSYTDETVDSSIKKDFLITYKNSSSESYAEFIDKDLYARVLDASGNIIRYKYIYWDTRFRRIDTIADYNGNIVGFIDNVPTCDPANDIIISE